MDSLVIVVLEEFLDFAQVVEVTMQGGLLMNEEATMKGDVSIVVEVNLQDELVLVEVVMVVDYLLCWMMEVLAN